MEMTGRSSIGPLGQLIAPAKPSMRWPSRPCRRCIAGERVLKPLGMVTPWRDLPIPDEKDVVIRLAALQLDDLRFQSKRVPVRIRSTGPLIVGAEARDVTATNRSQLARLRFASTHKESRCQTGSDASTI